MSSADLFVKIDSLPEDLRRQVTDLIEFLLHRKQAQAIQEPNEGDKEDNILAFAGAFADMSERDYTELSERLKDTRDGLFDRGTTATLRV